MLATKGKSAKKISPTLSHGLNTYLSTYLPRLPSLIDVVSHTDHHPGDHLLAMSLIYHIQYNIASYVRTCLSAVLACSIIWVLPILNGRDSQRPTAVNHITYIIFRFNKISNDYIGYNIKLPIIKYWKFRIHFQTNFVLWKKVAHFHDRTYTQYSS
jgi:hypothetical protein